MRSLCLQCIINKSEKWLFLPLFSHMFLYLSLFCACYLEESLRNGKWRVAGFPVCSPLPLFSLHVHDLHPPNILYVISQGRNHFRSCYDIICFNFNLTVMDVTDFLHYCAPGMQNTNSYNSNKVISFFLFWKEGLGAALCQGGAIQINLMCFVICAGTQKTHTPTQKLMCTFVCL